MIEDMNLTNTNKTVLDFDSYTVSSSSAHSSSFSEGTQKTITDSE